MGCDHPCVSFVFSCGYLGLFYYWWCAHVYMYVLFAVWVRFCFQIVCVSFFIFVSCLVFFYASLCFVVLAFGFAGAMALSLTMRTL